MGKKGRKALVQPPVEKSEKPTLLKLDLACGDNKAAGFVGVDVVKTPSADIVADLTKRWPWADASVDEVHCAHYVEHVPDLIFFMNELGRVLKEGGKATIVAPYYSSIRAWQDPTHVRAIGETSFLYYNKGWRDGNKLSHYPITCDFDFTYGYALDAFWQTRSDEARAFAIRHYWNVVNDVIVTLTKRPA